MNEGKHLGGVVGESSPKSPGSSVLFVAYYYPPITTSGANRSVGFVNGLANIGWRIRVVSVSVAKNKWVLGNISTVPDSAPVERSFEFNLNGLVEFLQGASNRIARIFSRNAKPGFYRDFLCIPDAQVLWMALPRLWVRARDADVVYVSCSPFSSALYATIAGRLRNKPVVLDFRDAWSLNPYGYKGRSAFSRNLMQRMEHFVLKRCSALILNTPGALRLYKDKFPYFARKFHCIPNGYDRIISAKPRREINVIRIVHVGSFYGSRKPDLLFEAIRALPDTQFVFVQVGTPLGTPDNLPENLKLDDVGVLAPEDAQEQIGTADILYLKQGVEPDVSEYIAVAAKTYEYLTSGIPMLVDCPPGDNVDVVVANAKHCAVVTQQTAPAMAQALSELIELCKSQDRVDYAAKREYLERYERSALAKSLSSILGRVVETAALMVAEKKEAGVGIRRRDRLSKILDLSGLNGVRRIIARTRPKSLTVLAYHRVMDGGSESAFPYDRQLISARPDQFYEQMAWLKTNFDVISTDELAEIINSSQALPKRPAIVTFDDGYDDFYFHAQPVLEQLNCPATIFVALDNIGSDRTFWYDEVFYYLNMFDSTKLDMTGFDEVLDIGEKGTAARHASSGQIIEKLKKLKNDERVRMVGEVVNLGIKYAAAFEETKHLSKPMSWEQVRSVHSKGVIVNSHTMSHPILTQLVSADLQYELQESKARLESELGTKVRSIAYPNGTYSDFDDAVKAATRDAGYDLAFAFEHAENLVRSLDPYAINRIAVEEVDPVPTFKTKLSWQGLFD